VLHEIKSYTEQSVTAHINVVGATSRIHGDHL